jgi:hypothetical protein
MVNFTLTITAAPELLAAMSNFTSAITSAKVVTVPQIDSDFTPFKALTESASSGTTYIQPTHEVKTNQVQNSAAENVTITQQPMQNETPISVTPMYNQPSATPINEIQAKQQAPVHMAPTEAPTVPTSAQAYTMEQLAVAATQIVDAGRRTELVGLLSSFGVQALTALPKEQYGIFATQLRALGAKI